MCVCVYMCARVCDISKTLWTFDVVLSHALFEWPHNILCCCKTTKCYAWPFYTSVGSLLWRQFCLSHILTRFIISLQEKHFCNLSHSNFVYLLSSLLLFYSCVCMLCINTHMHVCRCVSKVCIMLWICGISYDSFPWGNSCQISTLSKYWCYFYFLYKSNQL